MSVADMRFSALRECPYIVIEPIDAMISLLLDFGLSLVGLFP